MNSLNVWFSFFIVLYAIGMGWAIYKSKKEGTKDTVSLPALLGTTTFVATLFSTFTLMGMPDFFRNHGVGAWLFLGVTDVAMAFIVLWFGLNVRKYKLNQGFVSVSGVLNSTYGGHFAQVVYLAGVFVFLIPYVAIQLHGISIFFHAIWEVPEWLTSLAVLGSVFALIQIGGFGAIVRSDAIQWSVVFITIWVIGGVCLSALGGIEEAVQKIKITNEAWLSTPGPKGLFGWEFLVASFVAIILMPISQPQLTWRVSSFKGDQELRIGAVGIGIFSFFAILPTVAIGMYGAVNLAGEASPVFWKEVLVTQQVPAIGALAMVGLLAAAMSTADSQLHSLRREFVGSTKNQDMSGSISVVLLALFFAAAYFLSLVATNELVLLARVSFSGTALLAPMVLIAFITQEKESHSHIPFVTLLALVYFLAANFGVVSSTIAGYRIDLVLIAVVFIATFALHYVDSMRKQEI